MQISKSIVAAVSTLILASSTSFLAGCNKQQTDTAYPEPEAAPAEYTNEAPLEEAPVEEPVEAAPADDAAAADGAAPAGDGAAPADAAAAGDAPAGDAAAAEQPKAG